jgi:hypothetical protein
MMMTRRVVLAALLAAAVCAMTLVRGSSGTDLAWVRVFFTALLFAS